MNRAPFPGSWRGWLPLKAGRLAKIDRAAGTTPTNGAEPGARLFDGGGRRVRGRAERPAVEPAAGAARVDTWSGAKVLAMVEQDVDEAVAHLPRSCEGAGMVAIAPYITAATPGPVNGTSRAAGQALKPAAQALSRRRFHDEMKVVGLGREMD